MYFMVFTFRRLLKESPPVPTMAATILQKMARIAATEEKRPGQRLDQGMERPQPLQMSLVLRVKASQ